MGDVVRLPETEEPYPMVCENCSNWELMHAHFFVYEDGSFRCTRCGAGYIFKEEQKNA